MSHPRRMLARVMTCPYCLEPNNAIRSGPTMRPDARPNVGDWSLCGHCGQWSVFEAEHMRKPTPAEREELAADPNCQAAIALFEREGPMPRPARRNQ